MKHASLKRYLSLFLALIMVIGIVPANLFHAHATEAENPAVVVEDGGNVVINDSSNVVVNAPTKGVTNENTRVEIDYNYQQYQTDKDGKLIYDQNGKPIPVTAMNALSFESEKNRELSYTYPNSTKPLDFDYYWSSSNKTKWNQVFKGDYTRNGGKLRELLESTDPDDKYIVLMEDIKCTVDFGKDYDPIIITGEKVLDLNGHTLELYDKRNGTKNQDGPMDAYTSYMFEIKGTGETQGNQGRLGGALLTILDSAGSNIIYTDPKGETGPYYSDRVGKIYANAYMINHQKWDFWYYTHRDIFLVTGGDLVIYGGEFQAGRQQDQYKTGFSWSALKEVIGQTVALGSSVFEYASGISAATAAKQDKMQEIYPQGQKETGDSDNGQAKDKGTTGKKTGDGGTEEKKTETPATAGTAANPEAKKDQTVAQKQNDQNKKEDSDKKGDKGTENKKDDKKAAKNDKNTQLDTLNKNIAKAALDKDKITDMVDSAIELGEGIYDLFAKDNNTRCTACIQGTVARLGNECTMVIYGGTFIGHGSTPNVRNAVIETAYNTAQVTNVESDPRYGKTRGGWVYVYDGVFEAYTGANVFNMYENAYNQKMDTYKVDENGNVTTETIKLLDCETYGIKEVRYKNYDKWLKSYNAMSDAQKEKADGPELANTANISIRGGTFRCYYEYSNMAVLDSSTRGTDENEGKYCPKCDKYDDDCDDWDYHRFNGTPGYVNLGIESYDEDLIKDGRIQLVDVYGQGKLVLLDGGEPIEEKPDPDMINPATGLPYTDSELRDLDPDTGVAVEAPKTDYQTEGNFRHYRLYIGDQQLRSLSYLTVYPNTSISNSTFSFALETYWGTGTKTDLEWKSDDENIRAPYSSNEKFFDFEFDDTDTSAANSGGAAGVYIIPQLNIPNALTAGEELHTSNVWYYNVPVNCYGETLGNVEVSDTYLETDTSVNGEKFVASFNKTKKSGEVYTDKFAWSLEDFKSWGGTYYNQTDANYKTNIKFFTYKIYRVDPLSRENINESENWSDNEPLLEVRYGTGTDSLRCKLTLVKLEEQIRKAMREKHPEENWTGFSSGELYRVVFTMEEQIGFGYMGTQYDGEVKYQGKLNTASAQSSILFRCVSVNEYKEGTHENTTNGTSVIGRVPDWTPLQFKFDGNAMAGEYANVELVNGQTALVDWQGVRVFDIYYQWYVLDDPEDTTPTLIGGTDNVWVAQNSAGGKKNHKPRNFILKNDGSGVGINGELYANTVDPDSAVASMYEYGPNGLPTNSRLWNGEMLHMYTYETCPDDPGMRKDPNDDLYMANNYTFWGNSDSLYIPEEYAGKYLQVKLVAVNVRYPHLYDNLQTIASHVVPIDGISTEFTSMYPAVSEAELEAGVTELGNVEIVPTFSYTFERLNFINSYKGYSIKAEMIHNINGKEFKVVDCMTTNMEKVVEYQPKGVGNHEIIYRLQLTRNGRIIQEHTHKYTFTTALDSAVGKFISFGPDVITDGEWVARKVDLGHVDSHKLYVTYEVPTWALGGNYKWELTGTVYVNDKMLTDAEFSNYVNSDSETQTRTGEFGYTPTSTGNHRIIFAYRIQKENGQVVSTDTFTVECYVVADKATGLVVTADSSYVTMNVGATTAIPVRVQPMTANQDMIYTSSAPDIVSVDKDGIMHAQRAGSSVILVQDENKQFYKFIYVSVTNSASYQTAVGGVIMTPGTYLAEGSSTPTTSKPADHYAHLYYDENSDLTLTLHNYSYSGLGYLVSFDDGDWSAGVGIYCTLPLIINLEGDNALDLNGDVFDGKVRPTDSISTMGIYLPKGGSVISKGNVNGKLYLRNTGTAIQGAGTFTFDRCRIYVEGDTDYGMYFDSTSTVTTKGSANITIQSEYNCITMNGGTLTLTDCDVWLTSTRENGIRSNNANVKITGRVFAQGAQNGIYVTGSSATAELTGYLLLKSMNTASDSSYAAIKMPSGKKPTVSTATNSIRATTNNTGAGLVVVNATTFSSNISSYDFVVLGNTTAYHGFNMGNNVTLYDGLMLRQGATTTVEATQSVSGSAFYKDGVLYLNNFDGTANKNFLSYYEDEKLGTICLIGDNIIYSAVFQTDIEFIGDGNLTIYNTGWVPVDIYGDLIFSGTGTIEITGGFEYAAIWEPDDIVVNSGTVIIRNDEGPAIMPNGSFLHFYGGTLLMDSVAVYGEGAFNTPLWEVSAGSTVYAKNDSGEFTDADIWMGPLTESFTNTDKITIFADNASRVYITHSHVMVYNEAVEGYCGVESVEAYYTCKGCGKHFRDADGTVEIADLSEITTLVSTHDWQKATCQTPKTCIHCGKTEGSIVDHKWIEATCSAPKHCEYCNDVMGIALSHTLNDGVITKEAECNSNGILTRTCLECGHTVEEVIPADSKAHSYIPATCETPAQCSGCGMYKGYALGHSWEAAHCDTPKTCTTCGATEGTALGHEWIEATCTEPKHCMNCTATEGTALAHTWIDATCTTPKVCTSCGLKDGKSLGHTIPSYIHTADNHIGTCSTCGETIMEAHVFEDGACIICGRAEQVAPTLDSAIKFNHTLNLASDISANFAIAKSLLADYDMANAYVEFEIDTYNGNEKTGTKSTKVAPVLTGNYYYFTFNGLNATMMNDNIRATFYGTKNGVAYKSNVDVYSVATYAYAQLNKAKTTEALKTLCADLLRYGSTAQTYKGYRTDALASEAMTETHKTYLSDGESVAFDNYNTTGSALANPGATWVGKALLLDSKVTIRYVVDLSKFTGDINNLRLLVNYTAIDGTKKGLYLTDILVYNEEKKQYAFEFDGLLAAELRQKISVAVFDGSTRISEVLHYSVSTYGNGKKGTLLTLCKHLMAYSDSAKAYFQS